MRAKKTKMRVGGNSQPHFFPISSGVLIAAHKCSCLDGFFQAVWGAIKLLPEQAG